MHFYKDLYVSPNIDHVKALKWRLRHHAGNLALYVILLDEHPQEDADIAGGHLSVMHCAFLHQRWYRQQDPLIVGIAEGRQQAFDLVKEMMDDTLRATGGVDVRSYLLSIQEGGR